METLENLENASSEGWTDQEIVERVKTGDTDLYEIIMRRYNQRLYRVARAILCDDAEAEDVMQMPMSGHFSTLTSLPDAHLSRPG